MHKACLVALGADMKNRFLVANGKTLRFGPDIGDLSDACNYEVFKKEVSKAIKNIKPDIIACDLHPNYFSTQFAKTFVHRSIQHHHAHIASVMHEHNLKKPVIGVSFDGTGFGTDGNIWGGEFLLVDRKSFKRLAHLKYNKMPGGDKAVSEPWRMVLGILGRKAIPFIKSVKKGDKEAVLSICEKNINSPLSSSAGRLFDAAAALLGICTHASYEAEGPIKLEAMCKDEIEGGYRFNISKQRGQYIIDVKPVFLGTIKDLKQGKSKKVIATRFHNSMADIIVKTLKKLSKNTRIKDVALSGGVFQNKFLRTKTIKALASSGFRVFANEKTPTNDLNISLGQYHVLSRSGKS
ncbi:MAG: hypothetical protein WBC74_03260 [Candidatus Omnitrophota bacterium]